MYYGSVYILMLIIILALHNLSCIYICLGKMYYPNWIVQLGLNVKNYIEIYICSFYYVLSTLTTVGYGDISTYTVNERLYGIVLLIVGVVGYSMSLTKISGYF